MPAFFVCACTVRPNPSEKESIDNILSHSALPTSPPHRSEQHLKSLLAIKHLHSLNGEHARLPFRACLPSLPTALAFPSDRGYLLCRIWHGLKGIQDATDFNNRRASIRLLKPFARALISHGAFSLPSSRHGRYAFGKRQGYRLKGRPTIGELTSGRQMKPRTDTDIIE